MKKIITTAIFVLFTTVSANAVDFSGLSFTAGIASSTSVWGASAKETSSNETGSSDRVNKAHGVFQESYSSYFGEVGFGRFVSLGYEHTPDSISTPENINPGGAKATSGGGHGTAYNTSKVSVDFNDLNTTYVKLNIPGGMYLKYGHVETDLDIKETMSSGNTYNNVSIDGTTTGLGYQRMLGDSRMGFRFETNYVDFDNATTTNGVATTGNHNKIEATNIEGLNAKVALTITLGSR